MSYTKCGLPILLAIAMSAAGQSLTGLWDGTVKYDDYKIPFPIEFSQRGSDVSASFFNGAERVTTTGGRLSGDSLTLNFEHYATRLNGTISRCGFKRTH